MEMAEKSCGPVTVIFDISRFSFVAQTFATPRDAIAEFCPESLAAWDALSE